MKEDQGRWRKEEGVAFVYLPPSLRVVVGVSLELIIGIIGIRVKQ